MTSDYKAIVEAVNKAFSAHDMDAFLALCTNDIEMSMVGRPVTRGKDAVREAMSDDSWNPPVIEATEIIVAGDRAVCDGLMSMSKKSGETYKYGYCDIYTFHEGKISVIRTYMQELK